ncbi:MAG: 39S ribosomal protein L44, mitochondrial [Marteilia pararefringens]
MSSGPTGINARYFVECGFCLLRCLLAAGTDRRTSYNNNIDIDSQHEKKPNYSSQLLAFVAMLENREQQEKFLKEFFLTRLMNNDLLEYVSPLSEIIDEYNRIENNECNFKKVEFRILRTCGSTSVMPLFVIGLFGDYRLYSYGCGETVEIAIEMSKIDFVRRFYKLQPERYILDLI